jgi:N-formylglutamate amidohydrolase
VDALWHCVEVPGAGRIMPAFSRLVVDLNRQPEPVAISVPNTTPIVATETFGGKDVYLPGQAPTLAEIAGRIARCWLPFNAPISAQLATARARAGYAVLVDAHSICPAETRFAGRTPPPVAIKTGGGACCTASVSRAIDGLVARYPHLGINRDGQAKGGFIVHRHAAVAAGISAVQIEIRQDLYMNPSKPLDPIEPTLPLAGFMRGAGTVNLPSLMRR